MKLRKLWGVVVAASVIGIIIAVLLSSGILAKNSDAGQDDGKLFVYANTVIGGGPFPDFPGKSVCAETNRYPRGQEVVWRIRVLGEDGKLMDNTKLKPVVVKLPDGQEFTAKYGGHPGQPGVTPTDYFWSAAWLIPADYPTGSLPYEVVATAIHGKLTGTFNDFNVQPSLLTIIP